MKPLHIWTLTLASGLLSCSGSAAPVMADGTVRGQGGRGVLLVAVDSLRADHMSFGGYDRETTPILDGLQEDGVAFLQTFSAAPSLIPSHGSLLTGCDPVVIRQLLPEDIGIVTFTHRWRVPDPAPSLAAEFLAAGYATACFMDHSSLIPTLGFGRGFERFDTYQGGASVDETDLGASRLGLRVFDWVRTLKADRDWFAYVHVNDLERSLSRSDERWNTYFDPRPELDEVPPVTSAHRAYFAIPERLFPGGHQTIGEYEASYDGFVRQFDNRLGRLLGVLESVGRLDNTTICVVGTYGLGFGEAGLYLDHGTLSDVDLHVPWVIRFPKLSTIPRGQTKALASLLDVAPTLLDIAGITLPSDMHGFSQLPGLLDPALPAAREFTFSRGGLNEGFAVHDARYSFQISSPALRGDRNLQTSWYGKRPTEKRKRRRYLRDRDTDSSPGDRTPSAQDPVRGLQLKEQGDDWYSWMQEARMALHAPQWIEEKQSPEVLAELRKRGLIAPHVGTTEATQDK